MRERKREKSAARRREYVKIFVKDYDNFYRAPSPWENSALRTSRKNGFTYIKRWRFDEGEPPIASTWGCDTVVARASPRQLFVGVSSRDGVRAAQVLPFLFSSLLFSNDTNLLD